MRKKEKKPYGLGLIVGRFQGIHKGHEMMIDSALAVCGEVAVFVGSSQESGTSKNPFTYNMRREMLERLYGDRIKVFPLPDAGLGNCAAWGEYVIKNAVERTGKRPDLAVSGKEERRIRLRIEKEIQDELEESTFIDADPEDDALLKEDLVPDFDFKKRNPPVDKNVDRSVKKHKEE